MSLRRPLGRFAAVGLLLLAACGGPETAPAPVDAGLPGTGGGVDSGTTSDAGTIDAGTIDAGTIDAGTIDAGTIDAGTIDAGTIDAGTIDAGTIDAGPAPDAGPDLDAGTTADAGTTPDAGTTDAGSGGPSADCTGLGPTSAGSPNIVSVQRNDSVQDVCRSGVSDGTGALAVGFDDSFQPHNSTLFFVLPGGGLPTTKSGTRLVLFEQAAGYLGLENFGAHLNWDYVALGSTGVESHRSSQITGSATGYLDALGGAVVLAESGSGTTIQSLDAAASVLWGPTLLPEPGNPLPAIAGVDRQGNLLALWDGHSRYGAGTLAGQWYTHDGAPGAVFEAMSGLPAQPTNSRSSRELAMASSSS